MTQSDCFAFIFNYLRELKHESGICKYPLHYDYRYQGMCPQKFYPEIRHLRESAKTLRLSPEFENLRFTRHDYNSWCSELNRKFYWPFYGTPDGSNTKSGLQNLLEEARNKWLKSCQSSSIGDNEMLGAEPRLSIADIEFEEEDSDINQSANIYRQCFFCKKETLVQDRTGELINLIVGPDRFFCTFCLRHDFHTKRSRSVLVMTYRGIIGYLYQRCYMAKAPSLWVSQIEDMIQDHVAIGLLNPAFCYDPDSFCWFVDFAKVGEGKKRLPIEQVIKTSNEIVSAFNLYQHVEDVKTSKITEKYTEAIQDFYKQRYRPADKFILAPTLINCAPEVNQQNKKMNVAEHRDFMPLNLRISGRR